MIYRDCYDHFYNLKIIISIFYEIKLLILLILKLGGLVKIILEISESIIRYAIELVIWLFEGNTR